jgi:uncharacterized protein
MVMHPVRSSGVSIRLRSLGAISLAIVCLGFSASFASKSAAQARGLSVEAPNPQSGVATGNYYALVIGINDYKPPLSRLKTAVNDAQAMGNLLHDRFGFQVTYLLDRNATRFNILDALSHYRNSLMQNDNLLIYYAGHGYSDRDAEKAYWLPVDADSATSPNRIIADDLTTGVRVLPSRHVLIISDSCYSGALTRDADSPVRSGGQAAFIARMLRSRSRTLMASGGDEPVSDSGSNGHSVFAYAVLQALDHADESMFTASDLFYGSVRQEVAGRSEQLPQYSIIRNSDHDEGDFVFARVVIHAAPVPAAAVPAAAAPAPVAPLADVPRTTEASISSSEALSRGEALAKDRRYADAAPLLTQACKGGAMAGCTDLGWFYQNALGVNRDYGTAVQLYRKACDGGQMRGCNDLGIMHENGWGVGKDDTEAAELYRKACDGSDFLACKNLGMMLEVGKGVGMDTHNAFVAYRKACDGGFGPGCTRLGLAYFGGIGTAKDLNLTFAAYQKACDSGDAQGCNNLGGLYMNGQGVAKDEPKAAALAQRGCEGGYPVACKNLGWMYLYGRGVAQNDAQSVDFYRKGCDGGEPAACSGLGLAYAQGKGIGRDDAQAATLYRRACDNGDPMGCNNLGAMLHMGTGMAVDDVKAVAFMRKACDSGYARGCANLAYLVGKGEGTAKDPAAAEELYHRACEGGIQDACSGGKGQTPKQEKPAEQKPATPSLGPK